MEEEIILSAFGWSLIICAFFLILAFSGDPDLWDALIHYLMAK